MTRKEAIENHRKMWNWIADDTERQKRIVTKADYFYSIGLTEEQFLANQCYCCEYAFNLLEEVSHKVCSRGCPIKWVEKTDEKSKSYGCVHVESPYLKWCCVAGVSKSSGRRDWQKAAEYARAIANLPEKEDVYDEG